MHTPEQIKKQIQDICHNIVGNRPEPDDNLRFDAGMDSLDHIEMIVEIEKAYDINISDEDTDRIRTLQQGIDVVDKLLKEKGREKNL